MTSLLKVLMFSLVLSLILNLNACGRISSNQPIEGSGYPHSYPRL